jgi:hypothetical protein
MEATKLAESAITSAAEYHETLVDAFSIAAETAVWMVQYNCGWADANAEAVGRLTRLVPIVDRLTRANRYLQSFAKARIATKAASEAGKIQAPDGEWYASYHDAALGLTVGLVDWLTFPHYNEAGQIESRSIPSEVLYSLQQHATQWRARFDKVKGEYLAGMRSEAATAGDSRGSTKLRAFAVALRLVAQKTTAIDAELQPIIAEHQAQIDKLQADYRDVAQRIESEWAAEFGEPYPKQVEDWQRWAARVGWSGERIADGKWKPRDLFPIIEGYLQRLRDQSGSTKGQGDEAADDPPAAVHSPDFRCVNWFGEQYSFTGNQAAAVKLLWEAWQSGAPDVGGETLIQAADASTQRIDVVFRGNAAWGAMIVQGGTRGSYRLAQMAANSAKAGKRKRKSASTRK